MKIFFKCFFVLLITVQLGISQNPRFKNLKVFKGKANYSVNQIVQDKSGFIWMGTSDGLVKYDGVKFFVYTTKDSLIDNFVSALAIDTLNNVWIGHKNGKISILKTTGIVEKYNPEEGLGEKEISSIIIDNAGKVWFSTHGEGIYYIKGTRLFLINSDDGLADNFCYSLTKDNNDNIWVGTDGGISMYNQVSKEIKTYSMNDGLPDNIVKSIYFQTEDLLWIGMDEGGLCVFAPSKNKFFPIPNWTIPSVNAITGDGNKSLWLSATATGVVNMIPAQDKVRNRMFTIQDGIIDNNTKCIFKDIENNIWIGAQNGVTLYTGELFSFLERKQHIAFEKVFSTIVDKRNNLWICSENGLFMMQQDNISHLNVTKLFGTDKIGKFSFSCIYQDKTGIIWAGTLGKGVLKINPETMKSEIIDTKNGLSDNNIIHISGNNKHLVFSTLGNGVSIINFSEPEKIKTFTKETGLKTNYIYSSYTDPNNRIWLAQDGGGFTVIDDFKIVNLKLNGEVANVIYSILQDSLGNTWMLAPGEGVYKISGKNIRLINRNDGLSSVNYTSMILDSKNNLLLIGNDGIDMYNIKDNTIISHSEEDGVAYLYPNLNAVFKDNENNIWIGTKECIIRYNNESFFNEKIRPKVVLTKKSSQFKELTTEMNQFPYNENYFVFEYIGLWFKDPEKLVYRYKMEGYDIDWRMETRSLTAVYSNLDPGAYVFRIEVSQNGKDWISDNDEIFSFTILPPFWKTWWFNTLFLVFIAGSIYLYIKIRIQKLQKDKDILESEVVKRTQTIKKQIEEIETQRDQIAKKNQSITDSIMYARRIQDAVLPPTDIVNSLLPNNFILYLPKDIVSGDFYWIAAKDGQILIAAADCTGHGVPGAFMSMLGTTLLNEIVAKYTINDAGEILDYLRDNVKKALRQSTDNNKSKDGMDISLVIICNNFKKLKYAGAYNSLYIIRKGELIELKANRMPIGIHLVEKEHFTNHEVDIYENDKIYLFSDGFVDQVGVQTGRKFLHANFKKHLLNIQNLNMQQQRENLQKTLDNWRGDAEQVDDILVIGIQI